MNAFRNIVHTNTPIIGAAKAGCHITEEGYTYRSIGPEELADIRASGTVRENDGRHSRGGRRHLKYWSRGDGRVYYRPDQLVIRARNALVQEHARVRAEDVEIWDSSSNTFKPILS